MTRRNFELIASIISTISEPTHRWTAADTFAKHLKAGNPRFNIVTFMKACRSYPDE